MLRLALMDAKPAKLPSLATKAAKKCPADRPLQDHFPAAVLWRERNIKLVHAA